MPQAVSGSGFLLPGSVIFPNAAQGAGSSTQGPKGWEGHGKTRGWGRT